MATKAAKKTGSFLSLLKSRKTTYDFDKKPVGNSDLQKILEAARWSPSFRNLQPWEFVVMKDKAVIQDILEGAYYGFFTAREHPTRPPLAVALVLKKRYWEGEYGDVRQDVMGMIEANLSIAMPAMNMALQAAELGISSCLLTVNQPKIRQLLGTTGGDTVPLVVCLGYEKKGKAGTRTRKSLKSMVRYEHV